MSELENVWTDFLCIPIMLFGIILIGILLLATILYSKGILAIVFISGIGSVFLFITIFIKHVSDFIKCMKEYRNPKENKIRCQRNE